MCCIAPVLALGGEALAQDQKEQVKLNGSAGVAGIGTFRNGHWGVVQARVSNPTDTPQRVRVLFRFTEQSAHQFSREIVIPPHTAREEQLGVRLSGVPTDSHSTANETLLLRADSEIEIARQQGLSPVTHDANIFLVIEDGSEQDNDGKYALESIRDAAGLDKAMAYAGPPRLMQFEVGWDAIRFAAMLNDKVELDGAQSRALRRWLYGGGTLIVFADQVDGEAMARILGDDWGISAVDHVTLTTMRFLTADGAEVSTFTTERPISMTRVIAPQYTTHLSVSGWPALLSRNLGHGRIVVVAAGGRAWTHEKALQARSIVAKLLLPPAVTMGVATTTDSATAMTDTAADAFVSDQIGVRVLGRTPIVAILGGLTGALAVAGVLVVRRGRGEWLGVIGLVGAVAATGVLVAAGSASRGQIEPTAASLDLVRVIPGQSIVRVDTLTGLYQPRDSELTLSGTGGGWAWPAVTETAGKTFRMAWTDLDAWTWPDVEVHESTVRPVRAQLPAELVHPLGLRLRYTADGIVGTLDRGDAPPLTDAVLATSSARLAVTLDNSQPTIGVRINADGILPAGEYFGGGVLGATQQDRKRVLDHLFAKVRYDSPTLLAWADTAPARIGIDPEPVRKANALFEIPLVVERAAPGDKVRIPWPLIEMRPRGINDEKYGLRTMILYRDYDRSWISIPQPSAFVADFQLPAEVLPLRVERAVIYLDIKALGRTVRVLSVVGGKLIELKTLPSPDGAFTLEVDPGDVEIDAFGRICLAFDVSGLGEGTAVAGSNLWEARHFGLEVTGSVTDRSASPTAPTVAP